jgi:hypothetical protein
MDTCVLHPVIGARTAKSSLPRFRGRELFANNEIYQQHDLPTTKMTE